MSTAAAKQDTREALLEAGISVMVEKGYSNTGIQEILHSVGVPKGSFYYYFESKEEFALAMIQHLSQVYSRNMAKIFDDKSLKPIERLRAHFLESRKDMVSNECRKGCLIGNLSQEMADQSERLRGALIEVMVSKQEILSACIAEAQERGEIFSTRPARELSQATQMAWLGAMLIAKTSKDPAALDSCTRLIFDDILKEESI